MENNKFEQITQNIRTEFKQLELTKIKLVAPKSLKPIVPVKPKTENTTGKIKKPRIGGFKWGKDVPIVEYPESPIYDSIAKKVNDYFKLHEVVKYKQKHKHNIPILNTILFDFRKVFQDILDCGWNKTAYTDMNDSGFIIRIACTIQSEEGDNLNCYLTCNCRFKPNYRKRYIITWAEGEKRKTLFDGVIECSKTPLNLPE